MQRILSTILVAGLSLFLVGCGEKFGTVPVSITVMQKGSPLEDATVVAVSSDDAGNSASAITDASGVATMQTPAKGMGVIPGEYTVTVTKWESKTVPAPSTDDPNGTATEQINILPAQYADHARSGFKLSVGPKGATETFNIE